MGTQTNLISTFCSTTMEKNPDQVLKFKGDFFIDKIDIYVVEQINFIYFILQLR